MYLATIHHCPEGCADCVLPTDDGDITCSSCSSGFYESDDRCLKCSSHCAICDGPQDSDCSQCQDYAFESEGQCKVDLEVNDLMCGDGLVNSDYEECDDGNQESSDGCDEKC